MTKILAATVAIIALCSEPSLAEHLDRQSQIFTEASVSAELKDDKSAMFGNLEKYGDVVCGMVNAKNGYGAYMGVMPFAIVLARDEPITSPLANGPSAVLFATSDKERIAISDLCKD